MLAHHKSFPHGYFGEGTTTMLLKEVSNFLREITTKVFEGVDILIVEAWKWGLIVGTILTLITAISLDVLATIDHGQYMSFKL